jgi:hypothetical protein
VSELENASGRALRSRLRALGLSNTAIRAVWPRWWTAEADRSTSARAELAFSVARKLGIDPRSLVAGRGELRFLWQAEARFKHLSSESDLERAGITSFGREVAAILLAATPTPAVSLRGVPATSLRQRILDGGRPYVDLVDLLSLSWGAGVPVIHLRVFPWPRKRMAAMTARVGERSAVLVGKDSGYPAPIAFYLAHELAHIVLDHVAADRLIVDLEEANLGAQGDDPEEQAADEFALELLTGSPRLQVLPINDVRSTARELGRVALGSADGLHIEPGVLAQCFGYSTGNWRVATASLKYIYTAPSPVWTLVNRVSRTQLSLDRISSDAAEFLEAVLGEPVE